MSQQFQFIDIIFLGIIVLLLINRLRSVLGTRPSSDNSSVNESDGSNVVEISDFRTLESATGSKMERDVSSETEFEENAEVVRNLKKIK